MSKKKDGQLFIRLMSGADIFKGLENACREHELKTGIVISGIGQLKEFALGYFREKGDYSPTHFSSPHELLSLSGNIIRQNGDYLFHLHAVLGDSNKGCLGGHLLKGTVVVTNEIVILESQIDLARRLEEETGLMGLYLD